MILRLEHVAHQLFHLGIVDDLPEEGIIKFVNIAQLWFGTG
jgi:hypothetical protein